MWVEPSSRLAEAQECPPSAQLRWVLAVRAGEGREGRPWVWGRGATAEPDCSGPGTRCTDTVSHHCSAGVCAGSFGPVPQCQRWAPYRLPTGTRRGARDVQTVQRTVHTWEQLRPGAFLAKSVMSALSCRCLARRDSGQCRAAPAGHGDTHSPGRGAGHRSARRRRAPTCMAARAARAGRTGRAAHSARAAHTAQGLRAWTAAPGTLGPRKSRSAHGPTRLTVTGSRRLGRD